MNKNIFPLVLCALLAVAAPQRVSAQCDGTVLVPHYSLQDKAIHLGDNLRRWGLCAPVAPQGACWEADFAVTATSGFSGQLSIEHSGNIEQSGEVYLDGQLLGLLPRDNRLLQCRFTTTVFPQIDLPPGTHNLRICATLQEYGRRPIRELDNFIFHNVRLHCVEPRCTLGLAKACCVPPPPSAADDCRGKVVEAVFTYTGDGCDATTHDQGGKFRCRGTPGGEPVDILITRDADDVTAVPEREILIGDPVSLSDVDGDLPSSVEFDIGGQSLKLHTSCSKPFNVGDQYGSLLLTELTTTKGGTVTLPDPDEQGTMCVAPGEGVGTACDSHLTAIAFAYTGNDCSAGDNPQGGKASCDGNPRATENVTVMYTGKDSNKISVEPSSGIALGSSFRVTATGRSKLHSDTRLEIRDSGGSRLQALRLHTSCSKPLALGDNFGALRVIEFTTEDGGTRMLANATHPLSTSQCIVSAPPAPPHCTSKLRGLSLRYLGGGCDQTSQDQGGAFECSGDAGVAEPVRIVVRHGDDIFLDTGGANVNSGDVVDALAVRSGRKALGSNTVVEIYDEVGGLLQEMELRTSCSKAIDLGDIFGAVQTFALDRKDDGYIALGARVEYQYTLANPGAATIEKIAVVDDKLGVIASGLSLLGGESTTLYETAMIDETTTNTAIAVGFRQPQLCVARAASATVRVETSPPSGTYECTKPIDALTMAWTGADTVDVTAWKGEVGSSVQGVVEGVVAGQEVTVSGYAGSPKDVVWEIFASGSKVKLGESKFHLTCSDPSMDGPEDCGELQGDGKKKEEHLLNLWILKGIVDAGGELTCAP